MNSDSELAIALLSLIVVIVSLWVIHRVKPRLPP
jgi:hypothetical protein